MIHKNRYARLVISLVLLTLMSLSGLLALYVSTYKEEETCGLGRERVLVVKAVKRLPAGTHLSHDLLKAESVPPRFLPPNALLQRSVHTFVGQPLTITIEEGAILLESDF